jgi:LPLT family lysophospholipid transporter-like MFS transporter
LLAFAVVGFGAAAYAPAKYGLITELVPPARLVAANGWIEVSVVRGAVRHRAGWGAGQPRRLQAAPWPALQALLPTPAGSGRRCWRWCCCTRWQRG